ncbi:MAG: CrcB family protein [Gemmatimonadetes bacterium]|nr:CrcB family protein [Gemmatimonadota bacterium]
MSSWTHALWVGAGGFLGAVLRWGVGMTGGWISRLVGASPALGLPFATLTVNVVGCFVFGLLAGFSDARGTLTEEARLFLFVGLLGGFTTYSALGFETFAMLKSADWLRAALHIGLHLVLGIGAIGVGYALGNAR